MTELLHGSQITNHFTLRYLPTHLLPKNQTIGTLQQRFYNQIPIVVLERAS